MQILKKIPNKIYNRPELYINRDGERYVVINFIMYKIDKLKYYDILKVWKNNYRLKEKNIIIKDKKINKLKIIDDFILQCDCEEFKKNNDCNHILKLKKFFHM